MSPDESIVQEFLIEEIVLDAPGEQVMCTKCTPPCCVSAAEADMSEPEEEVQR